MANEQNLKPFTKENREESVKCGRKGGIASGEAKREKKTFQTIMKEILESPVDSNKQISKLAKQFGLSSDTQIKNLVTLVSIVNTLQKGKTADIIEMATFLGEVEKSSNKDILDKLDGVLKNIESGF